MAPASLCPFAGPFHRDDVDPVEEHGQLGGVDGDGGRVGGHARQAESPALEALVVQDEAAPIPEQDLAAVGAAAEEDEEMAAVEIELPLPLNDGGQPVVATAHVDLADREIDPNARRQRQHGRPSRSAAANRAT